MHRTKAYLDAQLRHAPCASLHTTSAINCHIVSTPHASRPQHACNYWTHGRGNTNKEVAALWQEKG